MYLLMHRKTRPTGKKIAAALGLPARFKTPRPGDFIAIRWGTAEFPAKYSKIQSAEAIGRAGNKLVSFQCFKRDGVPCPEFQTSMPTTSRSNVWLARKTHGMCGRDIYVLNGGDDYMTHQPDFYSKFIPNTREYRIHVFGEEILGVMGKYLDYPNLVGSGYIKNVAHGYRFRTPSKTLNKGRTDAAIAAVKSLGLDFGAVDLVVGNDGQTYVLEVNTAPALAPLTFAKYIAAFRRKLDAQ